MKHLLGNPLLKCFILDFSSEGLTGERTYDRIVSIIRLPINNLKEFSSVWNDRQLQYGECKILGHGVIGRGEDTLDSGIRAGSKDVLPAVINNHNFIRFRNKLDNSSEISICQSVILYYNITQHRVNNLKQALVMHPQLQVAIESGPVKLSLGGEEEDML
ncbi:unnamed protein product [Toxocara canis]|uniref:Protein-serine/threonine phosphatase n=1 Tax=Toxocara canis TaxID=6265 RepID=A0A183VER2_TOXCA|nr:unnamed protein product [Toxocara canis]